MFCVLFLGRKWQKDTILLKNQRIRAACFPEIIGIEDHKYLQNSRIKTVCILSPNCSPKIFYPQLVFLLHLQYSQHSVFSLVYVGEKDFIYLSMEDFQFEIYTKTELGVRRMQTERKKLNWKESEHTNFLFNLIQNNITLIVK